MSDDISHRICTELHEPEGKGGKDGRMTSKESVTATRVVRRVPFSMEYETFFKDHLLSNEPCIFTPNSACDAEKLQWKCFNDWTDNGGRINCRYFSENFGNDTVPVADCSLEKFDSHPKRDMTMNEYMDYLVEKRMGDKATDCLYLKDYHFMRLHPNSEAFTLPQFFSSDWLNEYCDKENADDYRFVYMGPKGSWTPFHADVLRSYSWSANIVGKKRWLLYPPETEEGLKDRLGNLPFDVTKIDESLRHQEIEVIQDAGEIIFIPSGWHHQVHNMEETLSINHNWLNGCSIKRSWLYLQSSLDKVEKEISDCKDMEDWSGHCQVLLQAYLGFNYEDLLKILTVITKQRLSKPEQSSHDRFDLLRIEEVLTLMSEDKCITQSVTLNQMHSDVKKLAG